LRLIHKLIGRNVEGPSFSFSPPLVLLQSDDWGRIGVRDREGYEKLRSKGLRLGENPYDLYSLETAADVDSLSNLLSSHRDSTGRPPCLVMNFCSANLDFKKMSKTAFSKLELLPLSRGLPGRWSRPGLLDSYRAGQKKGVFFPGLQGLSHFCMFAVEHALSENGERAELLRLLWGEDTPFIYWRMPWVGHEYWHPEEPHPGFLPAEKQRALVRRAYELFLALVRTSPISAHAAGGRANADTYQAWAQYGIRVAQEEGGLKPPSMHPSGILQLHRVVDFEPSTREMEIEKYLEIAQLCFSRGIPFVVSMHSINFHSSIKDFRTPTLAALDRLLTALESKYPELLYVHDSDILSIVTKGGFRTPSGKISVAYQTGA